MLSIMHGPGVGPVPHPVPQQLKERDGPVHLVTLLSLNSFLAAAALVKGFAPGALFCVSLPGFVLGKQQLDFRSTVSQHAGPGQRVWPSVHFRPH